MRRERLGRGRLGGVRLLFAALTVVGAATLSAAQLSDVDRVEASAGAQGFAAGSFSTPSGISYDTQSASMSRSHGTPAGQGAPAGLSSIDSFAFAIGGKGLAGNVRTRFRDYDLVVADGEEARSKKIAALHSQGKVVLGYLSVGTIENWRGWYREAKGFRLDKEPDWRGEWYAAAAAGFRRLIVDEIAPAILAKGFDGLFLDNTDMIETHKPQRAGMYTLVGELRAILDEPGDGPARYLFAQNGDSTVGPMLDDLDGWNREDVTHTFDFDRERYAAVSRVDRRAAKETLREVRAAGIVTTTTDYTRRATGRWVKRALKGSCAVGAVPFVSNIALSRIPRTALRC